MKRKRSDQSKAKRAVYEPRRLIAVLVAIAASTPIGLSGAAATTADDLDICAIEWDCVSYCDLYPQYRDGWHEGMPSVSLSNENTGPPGAQWPLVMTFDDLISTPQIGGWIHNYVCSFLDTVALG